MHAKHNVVAFTPYGRKLTVSILLEYMKRDHQKGVIDEWWLCMNTDPTQVEDIAYAHELAKEYDFIKIKERPTASEHESFGEHHQHKQMYTRTFYWYMTDENTVYLRFDDDIVYVHPGTVERMVEQKVKRPNTLGLFPIIWNNAIVTWHLQQRGVVPVEYGKVHAPYCMDQVGWADGKLACHMHYHLIDKILNNKVEECFMYQDVQLDVGQQFSVSCFAVHGKDYKELDPPGVLDFYEEEHWLTVHRPQVVNKVNQVLSDALVSHYTFYPQRAEVERHPDILDWYRKIASEQ